MTCRDEILAAVAVLERRGIVVFSAQDVINEMRRTGTRYADRTIRTHVVSRLCRNAPNHHAVNYPDLERVGDGKYRRVP